VNADGLCVRNYTFTELTNCWKDSARLEVDVNSGRICAILEPIAGSGCEVLPEAGGIYSELRLTAYPDPITAIVSDFNYLAQPNVCLYCPEEIFSECQLAVRQSKAASLSINAFAYRADVQIASMETVGSDFSMCFSPDPVIVLVASGDSKFICMTLQSTGSCAFITRFDISAAEFWIESDTGFSESFSVTEQFAGAAIVADAANTALADTPTPPAGSGICYRCPNGEESCAQAYSEFRGATWIQGRFKMDVRVGKSDITISVPAKRFEVNELNDCMGMLKVIISQANIMLYYVPSASATSNPECQAPDHITSFSISLQFLTSDRAISVIETTTMPSFDMLSPSTVMFYCHPKDFECMQRNSRLQGVIFATNSDGSKYLTTLVHVDWISSQGVQKATKKIAPLVFPLCFKTMRVYIRGHSAHFVGSFPPSACNLQTYKGRVVFTTNLFLNNENREPDVLLGSFLVRGQWDGGDPSMELPCSSFVPGAYECPAALARAHKKPANHYVVISIEMLDAEDEVFTAVCTTLYRQNNIVFVVVSVSVVGVAIISAGVYALWGAMRIRREARKLHLRKKRHRVS